MDYCTGIELFCENYKLELDKAYEGMLVKLSRRLTPFDLECNVLSVFGVYRRHSPNYALVGNLPISLGVVARGVQLIKVI